MQVLRCRGIALGLFPTTSRLRQLLFAVVKHDAFEVSVLALIILNCILLAMDGPGNPVDSTLSVVVRNTDKMFAACFVAEMVVKLVALGGYWCGDRYGWLCTLAGL